MIAPINDSDAPRTPKEAIYEREISPLMREIYDLCQQHQIPLVAQFALGFIDGDPDSCVVTTFALVDTAWDAPVAMLRAAMLLDPESAREKLEVRRREP